MASKKQYRFPMRRHLKGAAYKGSFHTTNNFYAEKPIPAPDAEIVEVAAPTHAEAYRMLCAAFLPKDTRGIMGRTAVRYFVQEGYDHETDLRTPDGDKLR